MGPTDCRGETELPHRRNTMAMTENAVGVCLSEDTLALRSESCIPVRGQLEQTPRSGEKLDVFRK